MYNKNFPKIKIKRKYNNSTGIHILCWYDCNAYYTMFGVKQYSYFESIIVNIMEVLRLAQWKQDLF